METCKRMDEYDFDNDCIPVGDYVRIVQEHIDVSEFADYTMWSSTARRSPSALFIRTPDGTGGQVVGQILLSRLINHHNTIKLQKTSLLNTAFVIK